MEVFAQANRLGGNYNVSILTVDGRDAHSSTGFHISSDGRATDEAQWDTAIIGGRASFPQAPVPDAFVHAAQHLQSRSRRIASICTGAFVLGAAGMLDGKRSTAHKQHLPELARRFPRTHVVSDQLYVGDNGTYTSGGVGSAIDLSLALIGDDEGNELARVIAQSIELYYQLASDHSTDDAPRNSTRASALRLVTDRVAEDPTGTYSAEMLAKVARVSPRHLTRLFRNELGSTPMKHVEDVRFERARAHLANGHSVTRAAELAGFGCSETMRRAFANRLGISPQQYQRQWTSLPPETTDLDGSPG